MNLKRILFLLAAVLPLQLSAKVTLPAIFTDNMVLQQQSDVKIWGRAKPGKAVKVTTSWDGKTYAATASASGGWEVRVSTPVAGGSPRRLAGVLGRTHRRLFGDGLLLRQGTL